MAPAVFARARSPAKRISFVFWVPSGVGNGNGCFAACWLVYIGTCPWCWNGNLLGPILLPNCENVLINGGLMEQAPSD